MNNKPQQEEVQACQDTVCLVTAQHEHRLECHLATAMREEEMSSENMQNSSITNDQPEIIMYKSPLDTNDCEGAPVNSVGNNLARLSASVKEVPVTVTINPEWAMGNKSASIEESLLQTYPMSRWLHGGTGGTRLLSGIRYEQR